MKRSGRQKYDVNSFSLPFVETIQDLATQRSEAIPQARHQRRRSWGYTQAASRSNKTDQDVRTDNRPDFDRRLVTAAVARKPIPKLASPIPHPAAKRATGLCPWANAQCVARLRCGRRGEAAAELSHAEQIGTQLDQTLCACRAGLTSG